MCGIAGFIAKQNLPEKYFTQFYECCMQMQHRGPDYSGFERFDNVLLVHHRLSIIDLDPRSHQPFHTADNNISCVYNGELYNYKDLQYRYQIPTYTTSDTEVLVESFEKKGTKIFSEWNGIFAAALFNKKERKIHLVRDRLGVKPLYYYEDESMILFASEAKVIYSFLPQLKIDYERLAEYMWYGNTITKRTVIKQVQKLQPASFIEIDTSNGNITNTGTYWRNPGTTTTHINQQDAEQQVKNLLEKSVQRQLVSDAPLGVLLSGGIDSSAIVAFASKHYGKKLDTYTVEYDYNIGGQNELGRARLIAERFNTNHHELKVSAKNIVQTFSNLVYQHDEPFADAANVPLYELAKQCSLDKKVILQGDGGDELFAGYRSYNMLDWLWFWKSLSAISYKFIPNKRWSQRMQRMSFVLNQPDNAKRMALLMTQDVPYHTPYSILASNVQQQLFHANPFNSYAVMEEKYRHEPIVQRMLYADAEILLPYTFLEKVDKATMLASVEARVPFLDNDLTDYVLALPSYMKLRKGTKKYLLKQALKDVLPAEILHGKKRGFDVPYKQWLRKDLYEYAREVFSQDSLSYLFNNDMLLRLLDKHKKMELDSGNMLWKALVLATWMNIYNKKLSW